MAALQNDPSGEPRNPSSPESSSPESSSPESSSPESGGSGALTPSEAPNNSFETGAGEGNNGFDSPPVSTLTLGNKQIGELDEARPGESSTGEVHGDAQPDVTANHKTPGSEQ